MPRATDQHFELALLPSSHPLESALARMMRLTSAVKAWRHGDEARGVGVTKDGELDMGRLAILTTTIGLLMSVNGSVSASSILASVAGGSVEGTVNKVNVATGTIEISTGPFGLLGKTLQLSEDTLVKVGDREASLTEILEGSKVTAYYETREHVATYIDLVPRFRLPEKFLNVDPRPVL